jgi:hypothetical protein
VPPKAGISRIRDNDQYPPSRALPIKSRAECFDFLAILELPGQATGRLYGTTAIESVARGLPIADSVPPAEVTAAGRSRDSGNQCDQSVKGTVR